MPEAIDQIAAFVRDKHPSAFCPGCVARGVFLDIETVTALCVEIGLRRGFHLGLGTCAWCARQDVVLSAVAGAI
jgi:hypothetical protein